MDSPKRNAGDSLGRGKGLEGARAANAARARAARTGLSLEGPCQRHSKRTNGETVGEWDLEVSSRRVLGFGATLGEIYSTASAHESSAVFRS